MDERVKYMDEAIKGRRFLGYTGLLKEIWMELKQDKVVQDAEDEIVDLVHVNDAPEECTCPTCNSNLQNFAD
ncbi:hypothetical protein [Baia soyae]|uniref:Uncharacterized protein n=1 Tax=Baia soyae TaxID=1544746 RepID=A0A4R2RZT5_9BACL|nr:hypothetical protein [Baia soyae]TCP70607.1 hypothetical protein EDD57_10149 [Baia soyae]